MESWWRFGQRVVCVNNHAAEELQLGLVYVVRAVLPEDAVLGPGFLLAEIDPMPTPNKTWLGFRTSRFRPVKDISIESLRALLNGPPDPALVEHEKALCQLDRIRHAVTRTCYGDEALNAARLKQAGLAGCPEDLGDLVRRTLREVRAGRL